MCLCNLCNLHAFLSEQLLLSPGERLHDVLIGVSDNHPQSVRPNLDNFDVCVRIDGAVPQGAKVSYTCDRVGRYVIVQLDALYEVLSLCEVEVYEGR